MKVKPTLFTIVMICSLVIVVSGQLVIDNDETSPPDISTVPEAPPPPSKSRTPNLNPDKWHVATVDDDGWVGGYPKSIVLDSQNHPHISYCRGPNDDLKYAYHDGFQWHNRTVEAHGFVGEYNSLGFDVNGRPCIAYTYYANGFFRRLNYTYHNGNRWVPEIVDSNHSAGPYLSMKMDLDHRPCISYYHHGVGLKYAHYDGSKWQIEVVDPGSQGSETSLAIDSGGHPHISYRGPGWGTVKYAFHNGTGWNIETVDPVENSQEYTSIALDSLDRPHISYYDGDNRDLKYAYYNGTNWTITTVDSNGWVGEYTSLALDSNDRPHITYFYDTTDDLIYTYYDGNQWQRIPIETLDDIGRYTALVLDGEDRPHMTYFDGFRTRLRYAHYDLVKPEMVEDRTPTTGTTGDKLFFKVSVSDNTKVKYVRVKCDHASLNENISLVRKGNFWEGNVTVSHSIQNLTYFIWARDDTENANTSAVKQVTITDNDKPTLDDDNSPSSGTTNDSYSFDIKPLDNIGVKEVRVQWSHGTLGSNLVLSRTGARWEGTVQLDDTIADLHYTVSIEDESGNIFTGTEMTVQVRDNDSPVFLADISSGIPVTGEDFTLAVEFGDNVGTTSVTARYSFDGMEYHQKALSKGRGDRWSGTIGINTTADQILYSFTVLDDVGNGLNTATSMGEFSKSVKDSIPPAADAGGDIFIDQHEEALFDALSSFDNIDITNYTWSFEYDGEEVVQTGREASFIFVISDTYNVTLWVSDKWGNNDTDHVIVTVNDITLPIARIETDEQIDQDDTLFLDASGSSDNVGISHWNWSFIHEGKLIVLSGKNVSFIFRTPGTYTITLNVTDTNMNIGSATVSVAVNDVESPVAVASVEETVGIGEELVLDGIGSTDNVGVTSYTWLISHDDTVEKRFDAISSYIFSIPGMYNITLAVRDFAGNSDSVLVAIKALDLEKPIAIFSQNRPSAWTGETLTFDGSGSLDNWGIVNWSWTISGPLGKIYRYGPRVNFTSFKEGKYDVMLQVTDAQGNSDTSSKSLTIISDDDNGGKSGTESLGLGLILLYTGIPIVLLIAGLVVFLVIRKRKKSDRDKDTKTENAAGTSLIPEPVGGNVGGGLDKMDDTLDWE